ncbi:MFS transporter [Gymnodinialimonas ceratoperidinii]|uniref:MFS transporter n=1 Tax=Gymnodinialimonas ceratoperidinii TaxID=2856823 RepID=A0A8F6YBJ2_9RHOB|nr:MFS transporter [Gymnodinialimonas ceratoperidinii]QXT40613.1 MFS transporter [Gymnodinialimonas ceratoperidinii]
MSVLTALALSRRPLIAFMIVGVFWGSFAAQVPVLKAGIGADDATFGLVLLGTSMGLVATMWLAPPFDRRLGSWAMPAAAALFACVALGPALASGAVTFFVAMLLAGFCSGMLDVVMNARVSELEARHGRSLMNANHAMFSVAYAISAILTGFAREAGYAPGQIFVAVAVTIAAMALFLRTEVTPTDDAARRANRFPWGVVLLCGAIVLVAFFVEATVEAWSALHIERTLGGRAAEGAFGPAILGLTMAVGRFSGQALTERFSEHAIIVIGTGLACIGSVIAAASVTPLMAYVGFGAMGLGIAAVGPVGLAIVGRLVRPEHRTAAVARAAVIGFIGFVLAPSLMGFISGAVGLRWAFVTVGAIALLAPLLAVYLRRSYTQPSEKPLGTSRL